MAEQNTNVNTSKTNTESGSNIESPNVTGAGETSRSADSDDIGNRKLNNDKAKARETGRPDTDMDADNFGGNSSRDH